MLCKEVGRKPVVELIHPKQNALRKKTVGTHPKNNLFLINYSLYSEPPKIKPRKKKPAVQVIRD